MAAAFFRVVASGSHGHSFCQHNFHLARCRQTKRAAFFPVVETRADRAVPALPRWRRHLTLCCFRVRGPTFFGDCRTIFYGLALLATAHFSPRSLVILGWAFLLAGLTAVLLLHANLSSRQMGSCLMGATFGLFHLAYAACTWPRKVA